MCSISVQQGRPAKSVFTIHNLAYQGGFSYHHLYEIGLPTGIFHVKAWNYLGDFLPKSGLFCSDASTAVKPNMQKKSTPNLPRFARLAFWLKSSRSFGGILNGVDEIFGIERGSAFRTITSSNMAGKRKQKPNCNYFNLPKMDLPWHCDGYPFNRAKVLLLIEMRANRQTRRSVDDFRFRCTALWTRLLWLAERYPQNIAVKTTMKPFRI